MSDLLCPALIGRSAELGMLTRALASAADGDGGSLFLTGDEGVGKSRLAGEVRTAARADGFSVLAGRCTRSAVPVPYRPVAEALIGAARDGIIPDTPASNSYRAALGGLVPEWSRCGDRPSRLDPLVVGEALLRLLGQPGGPGGLLVLEDLHWADPETLDIVEYLADNTGGTRVLCLGTVRDSEPSAGLDLLHSCTARRAARAIEVPRLVRDQVRAMASECLGTNGVPEGADRILAVCDGLPFAVEEILAAAVSSGELVRDEAGWHVNSNVSTGVPESIAGSVRARLLSLGPQSADVVVAAAMLGRQFDWTLLPAVAGTSKAETLAALQRGREVQIVEPSLSDAGWFRFRHSLTRDAILADLVPPERARLAAAAASAIAAAHPGLPGNWCELVAELSVQANQPEAAVRVLVTSGRRALRRGAVASALAALGDASRLLTESGAGDLGLRIDVDETMLAAYAQAGDHRQLAPLADRLLATMAAAGTDQRRCALVRLTAASTRPGDPPAAARTHLAAVRAIAAELGDGELGGRADAMAARSALTARDLGRAEFLARRALATAEAAGLSGWAAEVGLVALEVIGRRERCRDLGAARQAFERSLSIADGHVSGIWQLRARHELGTVSMLADGRADQLAEVAVLAEKAGAAFIATLAGLQLANFHSLGTDLDRALGHTVSCERSAAQIQAPWIEIMALCLQANIAAIRGDRKQAHRVLQITEARLPGDPELLAGTWGQVRTLASLFRDDLSRAVRESEAGAAYAEQAFGSGCGAWCLYSALQAPLLAPGRAFAIRALLAAVSGGDACAALRAARRFGADTSWNAGLLAFAEAVLAGRSGQAGAATSLADRGRAELHQFAPWWQHLVGRLVAPHALRDGWGSPAAWLRDAIESFGASGHDQLSSACRGILRQAGQPVPRAGRGSARVPAGLRTLGVTSREMDVFALIGRGQSTSEIAARLFISPKTVDTHIASLIAKTGQTCRRELVAHAARLQSA